MHPSRAGGSRESRARSHGGASLHRCRSVPRGSATASSSFVVQGGQTVRRQALDRERTSDTRAFLIVILVRLVVEQLVFCPLAAMQASISRWRAMRAFPEASGGLRRQQCRSSLRTSSGGHLPLEKMVQLAARTLRTGGYNGVLVCRPRSRSLSLSGTPVSTMIRKVAAVAPQRLIEIVASAASTLQAASARR